MRHRLRCRLEDHAVVEILRLFAGRHAGFGCRPFLAHRHATRRTLEVGTVRKYLVQFLDLANG
jgi:hypothetical protein